MSPAGQLSGLPEVDVVIPAYRPGAWLGPCLDSVLLSEGVNVRVWVVDDLPGDARVREEVHARDRVTLIVSPRNLRFAAAVNLGIAAGTSEYVLLLNQDARLDSECLARMVRLLVEETRLGSAGCRVLHQVSPDRAPDGLVDSVGIEMRPGRRVVDIGQGEADGPRWAGKRTVFGVCAAVAVYRRSALEQVARRGEIMDARFVMHKEDVDLAWRLQRASYLASVDGDAIAYHARGTSRVSDVELPEGTGIATRAMAILRQERMKSSSVRRLAWRNHLLLIIKNDSPAGLRREGRAIATLQLGYLATGLVLDPWGTISSRLRAIGPLCAALADRRSRLPGGVREIRTWLG